MLPLPYPLIEPYLDELRRPFDRSERRARRERVGRRWSPWPGAVGRFVLSRGGRAELRRAELRRAELRRAELRVEVDGRIWPRFAAR